MKKLIPVFDHDFSELSTWKRLDNSYFSENLRISFESFEQNSDAFFGSFVESLIGFGNNELNDEFLHEFFEEDCIALGGGLRIIDGDTIINPECCADFYSWKEWQGIIDGENVDVWMGHDPTPTLEFFDDFLRVWSDDHKIDLNDELFYIDFNHDELFQAFDEAKKQLKLVAEYVPIWADKHVSSELQELFISAFQHYLTFKDLN